MPFAIYWALKPHYLSIYLWVWKCVLSSLSICGCVWLCLPLCVFELSVQLKCVLFICLCVGLFISMRVVWEVQLQVCVVYLSICVCVVLSVCMYVWLPWELRLLKFIIIIIIIIMYVLPECANVYCLYIHVWLCVCVCVDLHDL